MMDVLGVLAVGAGALAAIFLVVSVVALRQRRLFRTTVNATFGLLMLSISALLVTIGVATQGYRALTREEIVATVRARPTGPQRFEAVFTFPDGETATYQLAGDQLYVDAHVLKWKPIANVLGLHTAYELDRVGGRYVLLDEERDSTRTVHSLKQQKMLDMYTLRTKYTAFAPLLDVEYGSGTFMAVGEPVLLEVRVSTTGLMIRRREP